MKNKKILFLQFCLSLILVLPNLIFAQGIEIESGASIVVTGAATIEIENGDFINNGTYTRGIETFTFSGNTAKIISGGNTSLYNLSVTNTGGISTQLAELTSNNLSLSTGGKFTIDAGKALTIEGILTTSAGTFVVNTNPTDNGSLILNGTASGNITYNRYMTSADWHLISSPVGGQSINSFVTSGSNAIATSSPKYGLAPYNNTTPGWNHYNSSGDNLASDAGNFTAGKGYEVLRTEAGTVSFTGTVATSTVNIGITTPSGGKPWNLVGNPFASALHGNDDAHGTSNFITVNSAALDDSYEAIYVWDAANSVYLTVNHTYLTNTAFYVAPGQSFFVYSATGGDKSVNFTEAMQTHQTGDIFKSGEIETPAIKLIAERSEGSTSTNIKYFEAQTTGLDPGYDAGRFSGGDNSFAIYTHLVGDETNTVDFDIQCLPANEFEHIIPVGLNTPENTELVFRAETVNMPTDVPVFIEDKVTGTFTALQEPGSFYSVKIASASSGIGRFFLHTKSATTGIEALGSQNDLTIIPQPQNHLIRVIGNVGNNALLSVYDLAGRKLMNRNLNNAEINEVEMKGFNSGIYIIHVNSSVQNISKRISWVK